MAVSVGFLLCSITLLASLLSAYPHYQQRPLLLQDGGHDEILHTEQMDLLHELKVAEIIPTVIDIFEPMITISMTWPNTTGTSARADYGNSIESDLTQAAPTVEFINRAPTGLDLTNEPQLTVVITDPDAPSRIDPEWSEVCHWIATRVPLVNPDDDDDEESLLSKSKPSLKAIMPYKPPGPPPKTGAHRYVVVALAPLNRTTEKLNLTPPTERRRWGYDGERDGVRRWAREMGLAVVGANFFYEQNAEQ